MRFDSAAAVLPKTAENRKKKQSHPKFRKELQVASE
jgi:hypothetical protein